MTCLAFRVSHKRSAVVKSILAGVLLALGIATSCVFPAYAGGFVQSSTELRIGEPVQGAISHEAPRQLYFFTARQSDMITLRMSRLSGDLDPLLIVSDEDGSILAVSDDEGAGTDAFIEFQSLPFDGRYFVIATCFGQEHGVTQGEYSLVVERAGNSLVVDSTLTYGTQVLGRINAQTPLVFYFLSAQRGDVITITMRRTSGTLDPHLDLATVEGLVLASDDDSMAGGSTLDAAITNFTVPQRGLYLVVATRFGREAGTTEGSYVLSVSQVPPESLGTEPGNARLIDYGATVTGSVDDAVPVRYFRFEAERGDVIAATLQREDGSLDPFLQVLDSSLNVLAEDDNSGEDRGARLAAVTLPQRGVYYLAASRRGGIAGQTEGSFTLTLSGRPGLTNGRALEIMYGATVSGQISDQHYAEEYVFVGQAGDVIRISMERATGDLDPLVTLYDSERKQIAFDDDSGGEQNALLDRFVLPADGMYILIASRYDQMSGTTNGAYLLTLELVRSGR